MEHMQHGGFMQGGMHHAIAKGVKIEQKIDGHTIIVRVGPMNLPAHTSHMKMPQPPDLEWQIPINGWLLGYTPRLVDANGNAVPGRVLHFGMKTARTFSASTKKSTSSAPAAK
jgi:hypothetical protein